MFGNPIHLPIGSHTDFSNLFFYFRPPETRGPHQGSIKICLVSSTAWITLKNSLNESGVFETAREKALGTTCGTNQPCKNRREAGLLTSACKRLVIVLKEATCACYVAQYAQVELNL